MGCLCSRYEAADDKDDFVSIEGYVGEKNCWGQKNGRGQYYFSNGDTYDGFWEANKKHGYGTYTYANGQTQQGFFENDNFVGKNSSAENTLDNSQVSRHDSAETLPRSLGLTAEERQELARRDQLDEAKKEVRRIRAIEREKKRDEIRKKYLQKK